MRTPTWLVRAALYPLHEALRGRPTIQRQRWFEGLLTRNAAQVDAAVRDGLRELLVYANAALPYWRETFADRGIDLAGADPYAELRKLPPQTKAAARARRAALTNPGARPIAFSSGGTSGDKLQFSIDAIRQAEQLAARTVMQAHFGVPVGARRVYFWGSPIEQRHARLLRWRDALLNDFLLNAFNLSPDRLDAHLARIAAIQPALIYGYPSALARLAAHALQTGVRLPRSVRLVVVTGEEVTDVQRETIAAAFGCPVAAEYGSREVGLIAHECPQGGLHLLTPFTLTEVVRSDGTSVAAGESGSIACTTLNTRAQPFLRYVLGDAGALLDGACPCGLPLPLMKLLGGKITGLIALPNGRLAHGCVTSHVLRTERGIEGFRTIQHAVDVFEVLLQVDAAVFERDSITRIRDRYRALFGAGISVDVRIVDELPPDPSGKRRYVISHVAEQAELSGVTSAP